MRMHLLHRTQCLLRLLVTGELQQLQKQELFFFRSSCRLFRTYLKSADRKFITVGSVGSDFVSLNW